MTQSNDNDKTFTIDVDNLKLDDIIDMDDSITINLGDTYGTTTTCWTNDSMIDTISVSDGTFTLDTNSVDWLNNITVTDTRISPEEIECMCKEYPALEKVWRNFKSVYDMVKQDYQGKIKAGEIDDDIPF